MRRLVVPIILSICLFVGLMTAWDLSIRLLKVPSYIIPGPGAVFWSLYNGIATGLYWEHFKVTLTEVVIGYGIGLGLALVLGSLIAVNRKVEFYLYPYLVMFQSMPKVALAPVMIIWFGLGLTSKIVNVAIVCFFPLLVNSIVGLRSTDPDRINLMRSLNASEWQIFYMLRIPSALPFIFAGLEVAIVLALIGAIVAEFVGAEHGLGMLIQAMTTTLDIAGQFSILLVLSLMGLTLNRIVKMIGNRVLFWDPSRRSQKLDTKI
jgi:NitT/TauT family transport system permease protein